MLAYKKSRVFPASIIRENGSIILIQRVSLISIGKKVISIISNPLIHIQIIGEWLKHQPTKN